MFSLRHHDPKLFPTSELRIVVAVFPSHSPRAFFIVRFKSAFPRLRLLRPIFDGVLSLTPQYFQVQAVATKLILCYLFFVQSFDFSKEPLLLRMIIGLHNPTIQAHYIFHFLATSVDVPRKFVQQNLRRGFPPFLEDSGLLSLGTPHGTTILSSGPSPSWLPLSLLSNHAVICSDRVNPGHSGIPHVVLSHRDLPPGSPSRTSPLFFGQYFFVRLITRQCNNS